MSTGVRLFAHVNSLNTSTRCTYTTVHSVNFAHYIYNKRLTYDGNLCVMFWHHAIKPNVIIIAAIIDIPHNIIPVKQSINAEKKLLSVPLYKYIESLKKNDN